ncbi:MAG: anhydro-N-acetylmuramic acid kinase [Saprospiraceae bacterium]|nr:anhydro-N-acetylmuramic acid kinase [Saprospiraceae bacterium]
MHPNLTALHKIAQKPERIILGLMSGTSMDGLDLALCRITGTDVDTTCHLLQFETVPYNADVKNKIREVFPRETVSIQSLTLFHKWFGLLHGKMINETLSKWGISSHEVDLIASHGQTVYHAPLSLHNLSEVGNATLQLGDADHIAVATGIITLSDFRQKQIAGGGEGAPLAIYGDALLFGKSNEPIVLLNIGGISNFTFLPGKNEEGSYMVTDCGPGNTLMDMFVQKYFPPLQFDENADLAQKGTIRTDWLDAMLQHPFFSLPIPKSTGQELFNLEWIEKLAGPISRDSDKLDMLATLNYLSALSIAKVIKTLPSYTLIEHVYVSGGGVHNPKLMKNISAALPEISFHSMEMLGMNPDAKEAVLFAVLANQTIAKGGFPLKGLPSLSLGKISFPL